MRKRKFFSLLARKNKEDLIKFSSLGLSIFFFKTQLFRMILQKNHERSEIFFFSLESLCLKSVDSVFFSKPKRIKKSHRDAKKRRRRRHSNPNHQLLNLKFRIQKFWLLVFFKKEIEIVSQQYLGG